MIAVGIIPARLAATRLANKPLIEIGGKPMVQHVWERASRAGLARVVIATPDEAVAEAAAAFGAEVVMTAHCHRSGTDRVGEAASLLGLAGDDVVVNIQGDEPLIEPGAIAAVAAVLAEDPQAVMASGACVCPAEDRDNPACVKVVCGCDGHALYFSRSRIPFPRAASEEDAPVMQHIGLYAYRRGFLATFASLTPTPLERRESLEQLRALENGYRIRIVALPVAPIGVDTPEDLERARSLIADQRND